MLLWLPFSVLCPEAFAERRVDSDGYVINDLLRLEEPIPGAFRIADSWNDSDQFFFLDRDMTGDASETKAWTQADKKLVVSRLRYVHRKWPELFTNLGQKVCLYRADSIKDPADPSAEKATIAATKYRTITFSNIFFRLADYREITTLVHEFVHVIDTGGQVSHSPAWVAFVRKTPSLKSKDDYDEILAEYVAEYFTSSSQPQSTEFEDEIYKPFFQTRNESLIRYSGLYRAGAMAMLDRDYSNAILFFEKAVKENQSSPLPNVYLSSAYYSENRDSDALRAAGRAECQFKALGLGFKHPFLMRLTTIKAAICLRKGALADARDLIVKLKKANPESPKVAELLKRVQEVERNLTKPPVKHRATPCSAPNLLPPT